MDVRILGPLEVLDEGRPLALGGGKQRALLALLALHANQTLTAERLIDELWGERPPATAAKTLQVHVSRLRKALAADAGAVVTRAQGYELKLDPRSLDAHRFERLVAEGRGALAAGRPSGRSRRSRTRSRCGAALHSQTSGASGSRNRRSHGLTTFGSPPWS